jgi:hypothetical protein
MRGSSSGATCGRIGGRRMAETWRLKRTVQCDKCPWRVETNPHDIPNGYCETKHAALEKTISSGMESLTNQHVMACHETHDAHCLGWLVNQVGPGNNIGMRIRMRYCENVDRIRLKGEQHRCFEDTLPKREGGNG